MASKSRNMFHKKQEKTEIEALLSSVRLEPVYDNSGDVRRCVGFKLVSLQQGSGSGPEDEWLCEDGGATPKNGTQQAADNTAKDIHQVTCPTCGTAVDLERKSAKVKVYLDGRKKSLRLDMHPPAYKLLAKLMDIFETDKKKKEEDSTKGVQTTMQKSVPDEPTQNPNDGDVQENVKKNLGS